MYCSDRCRSTAYRARRKARRAEFPPCEVEECDTPRRTPGSRWCERHYVRWYRHGDPNTTKRGRTPPDARCRYCGGDRRGSPSAFCSSLCATRSRLGTPNVERHCVVCGALLPFRVRTDARYCGPTCSNLAGRARRYGLTLDELARLMGVQDNRCAICGASEALTIDHCHATEAVRGLLCGTCNVGIGMLGDDPARLDDAAGYLRRHRG